MLRFLEGLHPGKHHSAEENSPVNDIHIFVSSAVDMAAFDARKRVERIADDNTRLSELLLSIRSQAGLQQVQNHHDLNGWLGPDSNQITYLIRTDNDDGKNRTFVTARNGLKTIETTFTDTNDTKNIESCVLKIEGQLVIPLSIIDGRFRSSAQEC